MPWRGRGGRWCKRCGRHVSECGQLSARYRCEECGDGYMIENRHQLMAHSGPLFEHWRRRSLAALGVFAPLDDNGDSN